MDEKGLFVTICYANSAMINEQKWSVLHISSVTPLNPHGLNAERGPCEEMAPIVPECLTALCSLEPKWPQSDSSPCQTCLAFG